MKVVVGSTNPVKIEATKRAFQKVWPKNKWQVVGIEVPSGVSHQPMTDKVAIKSARADFGVGLEGGLQKFEGIWFDTGWIVIVDKNGKEGIGSTIRMQNAPKTIRMVKAGMELGHVDDVVFKG